MTYNYSKWSSSSSGDDNDVGIKLTEEQIDKIKTRILDGKLGIQFILTNYQLIKNIANDKKFLKELDELYPNKNYSKMIQKIDEINKTKKSTDDEILEKNAQIIGTINRDSKLLGALSAGMESPARDLWNALIEASTEAFKESSKLRAKAKIKKLGKEGINDLLKDKDLGSSLINSLDDNAKKDLIKLGADKKLVQKLSNDVPSLVSESVLNIRKEDVVPDKYYIIVDDKNVYGPYDDQDSAKIDAQKMRDKGHKVSRTNKSQTLLNKLFSDRLKKAFGFLR